VVGVAAVATFAVVVVVVVAVCSKYEFGAQEIAGYGERITPRRLDTVY